jgi:hypothetical protein
MSTVCAVGYAIERFRQSPVTDIVLAAWRLRRGSCIPQSTDAALPPVAVPRRCRQRRNANRGSRQFQLVAAAEAESGPQGLPCPQKETVPRPPGDAARESIESRQIPRGSKR